MDNPTLLPKYILSSLGGTVHGQAVRVFNRSRLEVSDLCPLRRK
ncbi:hypothetical protein [Propionibacterium sp. oral taxon 192]|nr:hypothetical protein [Propionibacterium sp. oral taxon 192]